ncbi:MAG: hypothetical protein ACMUIL_05170 [bacterium]
MENRKEMEPDINSTPVKKLRWTRSKILLLWLGLALFIAVSAVTHLDKKIAAACVILYGLITPVFSGIFAFLGTYIAMIPHFGPTIIKVFTLPATLLITLSAYLIGLIRIKQGMFKQVVSARLYALVLAIGIIIGYILGKIF